MALTSIYQAYNTIINTFILRNFGKVLNSFWGKTGIEILFKLCNEIWNTGKGLMTGAR